MAAATQVSFSTIGRIWRAHGLKPHRIESLKLSNDPRFGEKLQDVVPLYLHPPEGAVVISVDEKCQIQALQRTQLGLPWKKGRCGTMTHDYKRHGTTTLFAGMNVADGISTFMPTHNHEDWIRFLTLIQEDAEGQRHSFGPGRLRGAQNPRGAGLLAKHQRFHLHFTPTSSSWLNQVERCFQDLTDKCVRRGVFHNVKELEQSIQHYIGEHNRKPKPYLWTAKSPRHPGEGQAGLAGAESSGHDKATRALDSIECCLSAHAEPPPACPPDRSAVPAPA